jgi:hypothetical protein
MTVDNPLYCRQADPCSRKFKGCMKTLEGAKQLIDIGHIKSRTIVPDKTGFLAFLDGRAELNLWPLFFACKLSCVVDKVLEGNFQQGGVAAGENILPNDHVNRSIRVILLQLL